MSEKFAKFPSSAEAIQKCIDNRFFPQGMTRDHGMTDYFDFIDQVATLDLNSKQIFATWQDIHEGHLNSIRRTISRDMAGSDHAVTYEAENFARFLSSLLGESHPVIKETCGLLIGDLKKGIKR